MRDNYCITTTNLWRNASFILKTIARAQAGETVAIISDDATYTNARVLADCARSLGLKPLLLDIAPYATIGFADRYRGFPFNPALKAAIEAADIVLMKDEPKKLATLMHISRKTSRIVWQNILFALGVKGVILLLGAMGIATMWEAVFGDVGVAVLAILNSMRAVRVPK